MAEIIRRNNGDVTGPSSATDGNVAAFDSTTGKVIKELSVTGTGSVVLNDAPDFLEEILVSDAAGPSIRLLRDDTSLEADNELGRLDFETNDTNVTTNAVAARLRATARNTAASDANPGKLHVDITPSDTAAQPREAAKIDETGIWSNGSNVDCGLNDKLGAGALWFDSTVAGARAVHTLSQSLAASDFSLWIRFRMPESAPAANRNIAAIASSAITTASANSLRVQLTTSGAIRVYLYGNPATDYRLLDTTCSDLRAIYSGQVVDLVIVRNAATPSMKVYINGQEMATTDTTGGTPPTWAGSITSSYLWISGASTTGTALQERFYRCDLFNEILSQTQIFQLRERGIGFAEQWGNMTALTSGTLVAGKRYFITTYAAGDDFSNVGGTNQSGTYFTATGTTPTTWTNGSSLLRVGCMCSSDIAWADPAFSSTIYDRSDNANNGTISSGVTQVRPLKTVNAGEITTQGITLLENASLKFDSSMSADGKYNGWTRTGTAGATLAFGDLCYLDPTDSRWELVDANSAAGADGDARGILGICVQAAANDGSATTMLLWGIVRADTAFPTFTVNNPVYASETAGDVTGTQPTTTDAVIRVVGFGMTGDELFFCPSSDYITHT